MWILVKSLNIKYEEYLETLNIYEFKSIKPGGARQIVNIKVRE